MNTILFLSLMIFMSFGNSQLDSNTYGVKNRNGILVFRDQAHLDSVTEQLNKSQQDLDDKLAELAAEKCGLKKDVNPIVNNGRFQNLPNSSDDNVDDCIDELVKGQKVVSAYEQFENSLQFKSLRANIQSKRKVPSDDGSDKQPEEDENDDTFVLLPADQAVLDDKYRIIIGNECRQLREDGDFPCQKDVSPLEPTLFLNRNGGERRLQAHLCKTNKFNWGYYYCPFNQKRRIRWGVGHYWWFFKYRAFAYTACQRRWIFNWWWPTLSWNLARAHGSVSRPEIVRCDIENNSCLNQHVFNTVWSFNYSFGWGWFRTHTVCVPTKTKSGWVRGQHYSSCCGNFYNSVLYF